MDSHKETKEVWGSISFFTDRLHPITFHYVPLAFPINIIIFNEDLTVFFAQERFLFLYAPFKYWSYLYLDVN